MVSPGSAPGKAPVCDKADAGRQERLRQWDVRLIKELYV